MKLYVLGYNNRNKIYLICKSIYIDRVYFRSIVYRLQSQNSLNIGSLIQNILFRIVSTIPTELRNVIGIERENMKMNLGI